MDINISGLKCDTIGCNYRDDKVPFSAYKESIGKLCPKCSTSLLTQQEYDKCIKMYKMVEGLNKISKYLRWINPMTYYRLYAGDKRINKEDAMVSIVIDYPNRK